MALATNLIRRAGTRASLRTAAASSFATRSSDFAVATAALGRAPCLAAVLNEFCNDITLLPRSSVVDVPPAVQRHRGLRSCAFAPAGIQTSSNDLQAQQSRHGSRRKSEHRRQAVGVGVVCNRTQRDDGEQRSRAWGEGAQRCAGALHALFSQTPQACRDPLSRCSSCRLRPHVLVRPFSRHD